MTNANAMTIQANNEKENTMNESIVKVYNKMKTFRNIDIDALNTAIEKFISEFSGIYDEKLIYYGIRSKYKSLTGNKSKRQKLENSLFSELSNEIKTTIPDKKTENRLSDIWQIINNSIKNNAIKNVIYYRVFEGLSFIEIAQETGKNEKTVRRQWQKAIDLLKNIPALTEYLTDPNGYVSGLKISHIFSRKKHITLTKKEQKECKKKGLNPFEIPYEQKPSSCKIYNKKEIKDFIETTQKPVISNFASKHNYKHFKKGFNSFYNSKTKTINHPVFAPSINTEKLKQWDIEVAINCLPSFCGNELQEEKIKANNKIRQGLSAIDVKKVPDLEVIPANNLNLNTFKKHRLIACLPAFKKLAINQEAKTVKYIDGLPECQYQINRYNKAYDIGNITLSELIKQCPQKQ